MTALLLASDAPPWDWRDSAACAWVDLEAFFPRVASAGADAKLACRLCSVRAECLEDALSHGARDGFRAGMSGPQRKSLHDAREERLLADGLKICVTCAETKPLADYPGHGGLLGDLRGKCRGCLRVMPEGRAVAHAG